MIKSFLSPFLNGLIWGLNILGGLILAACLVFGPYVLGIAGVWLFVFLLGQAQFVAASLVLLAMAVVVLALTLWIRK